MKIEVLLNELILSNKRYEKNDFRIKKRFILNISHENKIYKIL